MNHYLLYIDPGTGSMLFSIIIGIAGVLVFAIRALWIKFKFTFANGKTKSDNQNIMPFCIFSEGKKYWNVYRPICDEFEKRQKEIWYLTGSPDDPALSKDYKYVHAQFIGEGNKAISKMNFVQADIVLSTTPSLDVFQWKRSKNVKYYVHIGHAATDLTTYKMYGLDYYDAVLASGQYQIDQIRKLEASRGTTPKDMRLVGMPYLDDLKERLDALSPEDRKDNKEPVVLLAPSWGVNGILKLYGAPFIEKLVKTGYKIIIRPHPQCFTSEKEMIDDLMHRFPENDKLKWNRDPDNFNVLNESDILISDFSGVIYDFLLVFNKPIIFTAPSFDRAEYDCYWDDDELWSIATLSKVGRELSAENFDNIAELIKECLEGNEAERFAEGREQARSETWYDVGNGAKNITDYLLAKHKEISVPPKKNQPASRGASRRRNTK